MENQYHEEFEIKLRELRNLDINYYIPVIEQDHNMEEQMQEDEAPVEEQEENMEEQEEVMGEGQAEEEDDEEAFGYDVDSGVEDDYVLGEESEMLQKNSQNVTLEQLRIGGIYCANIGFIVIKLVNGLHRKLCFPCYIIHQRDMVRGEHYHVNAHIKTTLSYGRYKHRCYLCKNHVFQLILGDLCVHCHGYNG